MKTIDIQELYDAPFEQVPDGEEYSNFLGFLKNIFPKHTILGGLMGSTNSSKGIELGGLFGGKHGHHKSKPQVVVAQREVVRPPVEKKKDHTKMYMIGGGVLLLVIILAFVMMHKK